VNSAVECLGLIRELAENHEKIALIVSDQQMPGVTGLELLEEAGRVLPKAKIRLLLCLKSRILPMSF